MGQTLVSNQRYDIVPWKKIDDIHIKTKPKKTNFHLTWPAVYIPNPFGKDSVDTRKTMMAG